MTKTLLYTDNFAIDSTFNHLMAAIGNIDAILDKEESMSKYVGTLHVPTTLSLYYPLLEEMRSHLSQLIALLSEQELLSTDVMINRNKLDKLFEEFAKGKK